MRAPMNGGYVVSHATGEPVVTFFNGPEKGDTLTGQEARNFLSRDRKALAVLGVVFLPVSAAFTMLVGVHNALGWAYDKMAGNK